MIPVTPEQFLERLATDLTDTVKQVKELSEHHTVTVNLMKQLASRMGLELLQEQLPDGRVRVGWRQKVVVAAPGGMIQFPPGGGRR